ncbi:MULTISPECIES: hypothetical protein [Amycolatopsis]|uniref:TIR domain-containing protein n=1 Tax=Amycolatopsis dongchuanensis TaxID=1070866 RepID=A0ABP9R8D3_9PSEU
MSTLTDLVAFCENLEDDDLDAALGAALLGSGLGVAPQDRGHLARFAREWFGNKAGQLRRRVRETETYRIWVATAGPGQVAEAGVLANALHEQGHDDPTAAALATVLARDEFARTSRVYDIAVSFAGPQADYVASVVAEARALGLVVFHEPDMTHQWWGRNFLMEGRKVYGQLTLHFVPFISAEYLAEPRPRDAFETAMVAAVRRGDDYILPVLIGEVVVPPQLLNPHVGYLRAEEYGPRDLAARMKDKVIASKNGGAGPRDVGAIVRAAQAEPGSRTGS